MCDVLDRAEARGMERGLKRGLKRGEERGLERGLKRGEERGLERGLKRGEEKALLRAILSLMKTLKCTPEKAMDLLEIPDEKRSSFLTKLSEQ